MAVRSSNLGTVRLDRLERRWSRGLAAQLRDLLGETDPPEARGEPRPERSAAGRAPQFLAVVELADPPSCHVGMIS